jgi:putative nucleotidyltransferase with HDIG domain
MTDTKHEDTKHDHLMNESLRLFTQRITRIPTTPPVASHIIELISNKSVRIDNIVEIIEIDPAISAKVIGLSNTAFFRRGIQVMSISGAIMNIGFDNVKSIALGISLLTVFKTGKAGRQEEYANIFRHCLAVGVIAREIEKYIGYQGDEDAFTSGLLHDLGLMVIHSFLPDLTDQIKQKVTKRTNYEAAEREIIGFTHGDVGAWLADKWNLPENILAAIYCHHNVKEAGQYLHSVAVVHLADHIAIKKGYGPYFGGVFEYGLDEAAIKTIGISSKTIAAIEKNMDEILSEIQEVPG